MSAFVSVLLLLWAATISSRVAVNASVQAPTVSSSYKKNAPVKRPQTPVRGDDATTPHPSSTPSADQNNYEILSDDIAYSRWRTIIRRVVKMPNGKEVDYDIVDQKGVGAVIIFAWCSKTKTATLVREYNPGCGRILNGLAAGLIEEGEGKHNGDPLTAAEWELEEECHLSGGTWHRLTEADVAIPMDKYVVTEMTPYLVIDPTHVDNPRPLDDEEDIEIIRGISIAEILRMIRRGDMNLVGGWASLLAIEKLRDLGEIQ